MHPKSATVEIRNVSITCSRNACIPSMRSDGLADIIRCFWLNEARGGVWAAVG